MIERKLAVAAFAAVLSTAGVAGAAQSVFPSASSEAGSQDWNTQGAIQRLVSVNVAQPTFPSEAPESTAGSYGEPATAPLATGLERFHTSVFPSSANEAGGSL